MNELPKWLDKIATPFVVIIAVASMTAELFDFLSNTNFILIFYFCALLFLFGWLVNVYYAKEKSPIHPFDYRPKYKSHVRVLSTISFVALLAVTIFHLISAPQAFVLAKYKQKPTDTNLQLVDLSVTSKGFDIKLKNSGTDSAYIHDVWLLVDDAVYHPTPCMMAVPYSATYSYPFKISHKNSNIDLSKVQVKTKTGKTEKHNMGLMNYYIPKIPNPINMINQQLIDFLSKAGKDDVLEGVYWAKDPLKVSQVVPPKKVDRFLIELNVYDKFKMGESCDGGLHYDSRIVIVYDKDDLLVSDPFRFHLTTNEMDYDIP